MISYLKGMHQGSGCQGPRRTELFSRRKPADCSAVISNGATVKIKKNREAVSIDRPRTHSNGRLSKARGLSLLTDVPLGELMGMAHAERMYRHPGGIVSFVRIQIQITPNICNGQMCILAPSTGIRPTMTPTLFRLGTGQES